MLAKLCSGQSYFLSYFDRLTQNPFCVIVLCCLTPLSTIFKFYRSGQFSFIDGGNRAIFFVSFRNYFWDNTSQNVYFFCRAKREFFSQNSTLGYMTKTLNQIIFFPPTKSEYFFQQHWESIFFQKKNITPPPPSPLQVKWSFPH